MGLFETLTSSSSNGNRTKAVAASPSTLPTVVQMYPGTAQPILLDAETTNVKGYTALTYQALQVGALQHAVKGGGRLTTASTGGTIHTNPDVGVWNCRVVPTASSPSPTTPPQPSLTDALLTRVGTPQGATTFCWTVDLSDASAVELNVNLLQSTLVRHLIQHPPSSSSSTAEIAVQEEMGAEEMEANTGENKTMMTSLYDLQAVQFGMATEDTTSNTPQTVEEASKDVKICLMICAVMPSANAPAAAAAADGDAYKAKQAEALVFYHLRKFANAVNAALCFVPPLPTTASTQQSEMDETTLSPSKKDTLPSNTSLNSTESSGSEQPTVSFDKLAQLWRDLALGVPVWQEVDDATPVMMVVAGDGDSAGPDGSTKTTDAAVSSAGAPLYGPGKQQEDLIETLLLRNANYPGHWEASKDSLWVALPSSGPASSTNEENRSVGDEGWLTELRESIASAMPAKTTSDAANTGGAAQDKSNDEKSGDTKEVTDFFASLLDSKK